MTEDPGRPSITGRLVPPPRTALALVLDHFRHLPSDHMIAAVAVQHGACHLTMGHLRELAAAVVGERDRANAAARHAADAQDLLDSTVSELEDLRERYAELATERDVLTVRLEDAQRAGRRSIGWEGAS